MSTAEDIEAAYGIDSHDLLSITPTPSTGAADQSTASSTTSTTANTSTSDLPSPASTSTALPAPPAAAPPSARPRIVRGRGNRLFGVLQSTLQQASTDLAKDHQTIASRIQIQDRVRQQNQHAQAKLAALHSLRATRARLERDLADMNRRIVDVQMQVDMPGVHLRIEGAPRQMGRGAAGAGAPYARPVIMWRPGRHNERTRRELEAQQLERKNGLEASLAVVKGRVDKVKDELAEVARREREVEMEDRSPVSPTAAAKDGLVDGKKDVEMDGVEQQRAESEPRAEEKSQEEEQEGDARMDQD